MAQAVPEWQGPPLQEQLQMLCRTRELIGVLLASLVWQYRIAQLEEQLLLAQVSGCPTDSFPDPTTLRLCASLITLYSLFGFRSLAVSRALAAGEAGDWLEPALGGLVILVALVRYVRLAGSVQTPDSSGAQQTQPV